MLVDARYRMGVPSSVVLRKRRDAVVAFLNKFHDVLAICEPVNSWPDTMPTWRPRAGREAEVAKLAGELELMCGPAAQAVESVGMLAAYKPRGTFQTRPMNPVLVWSTLMSDPVITADLIDALCRRAIGVLDHEADERAEDEKSISGRVVRAVSMPRRIWQAATGAPADAAAHKSAFVSGIVVTVLTGLLVAFLAHYFGWA